VTERSAANRTVGVWGLGPQADMRGGRGLRFPQTDGPRIRAGDGNRTRTVSLGTVQDPQVAPTGRRSERHRVAWSDPLWPARMAR